MKQRVIDKLNEVEVSGLMAAVVDYLLDGDERYVYEVSPRIAQMYGTVDGVVLLEREREVGANLVLGSKQDLFSNVTGLAGCAGLDQEEVDWLLSQIPSSCRVDA